MAIIVNYRKFPDYEQLQVLGGKLWKKIKKNWSQYLKPAQSYGHFWPFLPVIGNFWQFLKITGDFWYLHVLCCNFWEKILKNEVNISIQYKVMDLDKLSKVPNFSIFMKIAKIGKNFAVVYLVCNSLHFEVLQAYVWKKKVYKNYPKFVISRFVKIKHFAQFLVIHYLAHISLQACPFLGWYLISLQRYGRNKLSYKCCTQLAILNRTSFKKQLSFSFWDT